MALDTIDRQNAITIFIEAAVDPVGCEDRTNDLTSENYDENLLSENCAKTFSSEDRDKIITAEAGQWWSTTELNSASCTSTPLSCCIW